MRRKIYDRLLEWKYRKNHKSLIVKGQRQIGETYIITKFAEENYENCVKVDFSEEPDIGKVFEQNLNINRIVSEISLLKDADVVPGSTLLFFDEIQECPLARASLKYFTMDGRYDVVASGSLPGVVDARLRHTNDPPPLLPLGYEEHITMVSMDFEEFLWAVSFDTGRIDEVKKHIRERRELGYAMCSVLSGHFRDYMIVGGMPEAVKAFVEEKSYRIAGQVLDDILSTCRADITRYNKGINIVKTAECFNSIPSQLSQTNKKFTYSRIEPGSGSRNSAQKYMENLLWIQAAGYGNFCYAVNAPKIPLKMQEVRDSFKVYLSDTGMLIRMIGLDAACAVLREDTGFNEGSVTENIVAECLFKNGLSPRYYRKTNGENKMEIDFVIELNSEIFAIEVKSGKSRDAPSLHKVGRIFHIDRRIKFEKSDIYVDDDGIEHYPLFASAFATELAKPMDGPDL